MIEAGTSEWAAKYGSECHCTVWVMILDFWTWLH